uniref:Uncharacterized protein n=1 Tax=Arundo donax TaxID=35708 RepID=A0A0A8Z2P5_ARUDO
MPHHRPGFLGPNSRVWLYITTPIFKKKVSDVSYICNSSMMNLTFLSKKSVTYKIKVPEQHLVSLEMYD